MNWRRWVDPPEMPVWWYVTTVFLYSIAIAAAIMWVAWWFIGWP